MKSLYPLIVTDPNFETWFTAIGAERILFLIHFYEIYYIIKVRLCYQKMRKNKIPTI